jgi:hypothetical protein
LIFQGVFSVSHIKEKIIHLAVFLSFFAAVLFVFSCSVSTSPETGQGQVKITMVDAPAGYDEVNIVVVRVEVHKADAGANSGWFVINNNSATYDLLLLRNGASVVLGDHPLDAGRYTQIRLIIGTGSNVVVDGVTYPLEIPSGEQTGVKLNHSFVIEDGLLYELLLDFDAERSIVVTGNGQYKLKPVIRVTPVVISGSISGKINPLNATGFVYAISGTDTALTVAEPITGSFMLMALLEKNYRVEIFSADPAYNDTTITDVIVVAQQNTNLGTINLSIK